MKSIFFQILILFLYDWNKIWRSNVLYSVVISFTGDQSFPLIDLFAFASIHSKGVKESSKNGNGRSDDGSSAHGCLESNNGGDDDDNTFDGVSNSVCDGVNLSESQESNLIVGVVSGSSKCEESSKALVGEISSGNKVLETSEESSSFHCQTGWDKDDGRDGSEDSVQVLGIKVLSDLLSTHCFLRKNSTGSGRNVGKHSRGKGQESERKLLHGSNSNSSNDGKKSQVNGKGKNFLKKQSVKTAGDNGFGGFDDVSERDGTSTKSNNGTNVNTGVAKSDGNKSFDVIHAEFGSFTDLEKPKWDEVENSGGHLKSCDGPWVSEGVKSLFVVDIVTDVKEIPQSKVCTDL